MIKIKSSQKIFTDAETATLTGIGLDRLRHLARTRHIGFLVGGAEAVGSQAEQWLFTPSDLMILATLYRRGQL